MGRIVTIILKKKIYLEQILSYPFTPVPMCFAHMNRKTNKTTKSTLFKELENWPPRKMDANCSGGSESSLHRISFSIVKSLPKRRLLEHTQKDLYSGLPQVKRDSVMHTDECTGGWERWLPAISTRKRSFRKVNTDFGYIHRRKESKK
jgi:hypothetical protein